MKPRVVLLVLLGTSSYAQTGTFTATGNMTTPRFSHTATLLPNGKVLIAGGNTVCDPRCRPVTSAELYDPAIGTFTPAGSLTMADIRSAVLLPDGRVLIAGVDITRTVPSLELYDPSSGTFVPAVKPATLTGVGVTALLKDGRVLLSGTVSTPPRYVLGAELYDPVAGTSTPAANWPEFYNEYPLVLTDGSVLLLSYDSEPGIYDVAAGTFRLLSSPYSDYYPVRQAILLLNGAVLFTGGNDGFGIVNRAKLYDPLTGTFVATQSMSTPRDFHSATLLPDGTVLVAGGAGQSGSGQGLLPPLAGAEIYDPATSRFSATGNLTSVRYGHTATLLNNGQVLLTGGVVTPGSVGTSGSATASAELYTPAVLVPAPALFSLSGDGQGQGAIWHAQTSQIASVGNPAAAGEALSMYTTSLADGSVIPPQVIVGGRLAQVLYFGAAPGYPGYYQVNFVVPDGVPTGPAVSVRLIYIGRSSNAVTIGVQ